MVGPRCASCGEGYAWRPHVCEAVKESHGCTVQQNVEEQSTLAGAVPPAPLTRELHSSTLAELEGLPLSGTVEELQTFLCLPNDPDHLQYQSGVQRQSHIGGVEYYYSGLPSLSSINYHNVPCAVCYVATRSVAVMAPAKTRCPTNWTVEYIGYLMAGRQHYHYDSRTMYECVDERSRVHPRTEC